MPMQWKTPEAFQRLLAAMVAAQDMKLDYRKIASYYGEGATYDAIEGRFRIIKKDAQKLKSEIDNGDRAPAPARGATASTNNEATPKTPRAKKTNGNGTPTTARKDKVIAGRVNKNVATPRKGVKVEGINGEDYLMMDDGIENGNGNMVMGVKAEVDSSGSSFFGGEEDAVGEVVNGWTYGDLGI